MHHRDDVDRVSEGLELATEAKNVSLVSVPPTTLDGRGFKARWRDGDMMEDGKAEISAE